MRQKPKQKPTKGITAIRGTSAYVVLEHPFIFEDYEFDARVHGVYSSRTIADQKAKSLFNKVNPTGYISILKKPILGPTLKADHMECEEFGMDQWVIENIQANGL